MTRPIANLRRLAAGGCLTLLFLVIVAWIIGAFWELSLERKAVPAGNGPSYYNTFSIGAGRLRWTRASDGVFTPDGGPAGSFAVSYKLLSAVRRQPGQATAWDYSAESTPWTKAWAGVSVSRGPNVLGAGYRQWRTIEAPCSLLTIALCVPTLVILRGWGRRRLLRHRADANLCVRCGYDLRATPGRCPECGEGVLQTASSDAARERAG